MKRPALLTTASIVLAWYIVTGAGLVRPLFLPSPISVATEFYAGLVSGQFVADSGATIARWLSGFVAGALVGVALGMLMGLSKTLYRQLELPVEFLRAVPIVSVLPLFLVFFGLGNASKVAASAWAAFLYSLVNAMYGARNVRTTRLEMAASYRASKWNTLRYVVLPDALATISAGLRIALSMSLVVVVATEMLLGTDVGLGRRIYDAVTIYRMAQAYAAIILVGALGYLANRVALGIERRLIHWHGR